MAYQPDKRNPPPLRLVGQTPGDEPPASVVANQDATDRPAAGRVPPGAQPALLATKLGIPPSYRSVVTRSRLLDQLSQGLHCKLTLIAAPAGFGKTTLLGDWIRQSGRPTAWVSLDDGDNDPIRFWSYAVAAVDRLHPGAGESVLALLHSPQAPPIDAVLTVFINAIADVADGSTLVLDDYHVIDSAPVHQALAFFLDRLPPQMHLILATRTDPPLPLARLRARGQLLELRAPDLRFQAGETASFLTGLMGLSLSAQQVAQLAERTEGWIAGLQLTALSLQKRDDVAPFINDLAGTHRFILDYLAEEVLARQSEDVCSFLLQTSILERLNGSLCDAVTGQSSGQAMLEGLERANLFVLPLDEERRWYRYHHLFAEFLRSRLLQEQSQLVATLHQRASLWYEHSGLPGEAIGHTLAARDYPRGADLIEQAAQTWLMSGEMATLRRWVELLPDETTLSRPKLCLAYAWLLVFAFQMEQVERYVRAAEQAAASLSDPERRSLLDEIATMRATAATLQADERRILELSRREKIDHAGDNAFLRSVGQLNVALRYELSGDVLAASQAYLQASTSSQATGNVTVAIFALSQLADQQVVQGQLHRAADTCRQALRLAGSNPDDDNRRPVSVAALAHFSLAMILYEWNDLPAAHEHVLAALAQGEQLANAVFLAGGYLGLARLQYAEGDRSAALESLRRADQALATTDFSPLLESYLAAWRARFWIMNDDLDAAAGWAEQSRQRMAQRVGKVPRLFPLEIMEQASLLRALIAQGRSLEALELVEPLRQEVEADGRTGNLIELLMLQALGRQAHGDLDAALIALERSLTLAAPEGYMRLYIDEGAPMAALLSRLAIISQRAAAARADIPVDYLDRLLAASGEAAPGGGTPLRQGASGQMAGQAAPLAEPLSEREQEVLRLVAAGLSNQDIAGRLVVEVSTVKTHLLHLYGKLGVHSRTQAISRAKELSLL